MDKKRYCVIDSAKYYKTIAYALLVLDESGQEQEQLQNYTLKDGETLLDAPPPTRFIKPRWNGTAWEEAATPEEIAAADTRTLEQVKSAKLQELSHTCEQTIFSGLDIETSRGKEHFSLTLNDQTNISVLAGLIAQGAAAVPYHADGELCREFSAAEFTAVMTAATAFKTHNTTLCNHLNVWARRCVSVAEVDAITYTSPLPADLQNNFDAILGGAHEAG